MLELGIGADVLRGVGWIVRLLFLSAIAYALWSGKNWKRKLLNVALVVLVFSAPLWPSIGERIRYERKYKAAKALFDERCKRAGEGTDTVRTTITHTLAANVENLMLNTTALVDGTGNALGNVLYAGAGDNVLDGLGGNDWVSYVYAGSAVNVSLAATGAQATGGSGTDTLRNVEYLFGSNYDDILRGSSRADVLSGGLGNDTLDAGARADTLNGGAGDDTYRYRSGDGNDTVSDAGGDDTVELLDLDPGDVRIVQGLDGNPDHIVDALTGHTITLDLNLVSPGWSADGPQVEHLRFADGTVWNSEQMRAAAELERSVSLMVQAMATFSVPAPGLVTATPLDDPSRLAPVLAASWG